MPWRRSPFLHCRARVPTRPASPTAFRRRRGRLSRRRLRGRNRRAHDTADGCSASDRDRPNGRHLASIRAPPEPRRPSAADRAILTAFATVDESAAIHDADAELVAAVIRRAAGDDKPLEQPEKRSARLRGTASCSARRVQPHRRRKRHRSRTGIVHWAGRCGLWRRRAGAGRPDRDAGRNASRPMPNSRCRRLNRTSTWRPRQRPTWRTCAAFPGRRSTGTRATARHRRAGLLLAGSSPA